MYQQVYYHRTRKIYDFHLQQFLEGIAQGQERTNFPVAEQRFNGFLHHSGHRNLACYQRCGPQDKDLPGTRGRRDASLIAIISNLPIGIVR